ncbi:MAG: class I SAM-dependent methyltransferase [Firmicutes bacterium]|nr:class I SAM-dependent methyltransferase [Bacillota bacterium]
MHLSPRLEAALSFIDGFEVLADVGTDHAYLPIQAVLLHKVKKAIASDNKKKPLENAIQNITKAGLAQSIKVIESDGLSHLTKEVDCISLLGMGGELISSILSKADLSNVKRLVLGPNSDAFLLRDWLQKNDFLIIDEMYIQDKSIHYQIMACLHGTMELSDMEKEFGPIILKQKNQIFLEFIDSLILKLENAVKKTKQEDTKLLLNKRLNALKELTK